MNTILIYIDYTSKLEISIYYLPPAEEGRSMSIISLEVVVVTTLLLLLIERSLTRYLLTLLSSSEQTYSLPIFTDLPSLLSTSFFSPRFPPVSLKIL